MILLPFRFWQIRSWRNPNSFFSAIVVIIWSFAVSAQESLPGANVESLLSLAKERNPEYINMRHEAAVAAERIEPAGALPDPKFRMELRDISRMGQQDPTLIPNRVGSTRYLFTQDLPWFGKLDLKREIAELEAVGTTGRTMGTWADLAAKIKIAHAQRYYLYHNKKLTQEILDLMIRLEKISQARYANGLAAQQDVIRAQVEQTKVRNEQIVLDSEIRQINARLNALLARPSLAPLANPEKLHALPAPAKLDFTMLEAQIRAVNPLLSTETANIKAAEKGRELTYKNRYPDFTVGGGTVQYQNSLKEWEVMVEFNIPFPQFSARNAQEREAEEKLLAAKSRKEATANQLIAQLSENLAGIEAAHQTEILITTHLLPQAELTFRSALVGYETGKVDFATLLEAQRQISQAKQNQIKAQTEVHTRIAEIEKLLGEDL